jgi:[acyl-carrier-protein] S-malonyltransferase
MENLNLKTAYVFPGQASQFPGMGKEMYESNPKARKYFEDANVLLGFRISDIMFNGNAEDLKQTRVTQPAVYLHSVISAFLEEDNFRPDVVAGHSLGEFSALVASGSLNFEDGLQLVFARAMAMQKACEDVESTMAAVIGLDDETIEDICMSIDELVIPANYNCPGQLVISGTIRGVHIAMERLKEAGARMVVEIAVGGAFHSPLMAPAQDELERAIADQKFLEPRCPIYQNVSAEATRDPETIQQNLIRQLTAPVKWTQTMMNMRSNGIGRFIEVGGNGKTLTGFVKRLDRKIPTLSI